MILKKITKRNLKIKRNKFWRSQTLVMEVKDNKRKENVEEDQEKELEQIEKIREKDSKTQIYYCFKEEALFYTPI